MAKICYSILLILLTGLMFGCSVIKDNLPTIPVDESSQTSVLTNTPIINIKTNTPTTTRTITPSPTLLLIRTTTPTKNATHALTPTATYDLPPDLLTPVTDDTEDCIVVPAPVINDMNDPNDRIFLSGTFYLCRQYPLDMPLDEFDLDSGGMRSQTEKSNDIDFGIHYNQIDGMFEYYIGVINSAVLKDMNQITPNENTCQLAVQARSDFILIDVKGNETACILTTEGRVGMVRVEQINPYGWGSIEISFVVWEK